MFVDFIDSFMLTRNLPATSSYDDVDDAFTSE